MLHIHQLSNTLWRTVAEEVTHHRAVHDSNKSRLERAAGDVRRFQAALDARSAAAPDSALELEMIAADLRRAKIQWRRLMQDVLAPQIMPALEQVTPLRNPIALPEFEGAR
jgi:hypothetical protein